MQPYPSKGVAMPDPLKVRGQCPVCGKSVTKNAPRGRVTWRGACTATSGCAGQILARRFRSDEPSTEDNGNTDDPTQPPAPPKTRRGRPRKVPKVGYTANATKDTDEDGESGSPPTDVQGTGGTSADNDAGSNPPTDDAPQRQPKRKREYPYGSLFGW
jgi:hypothetical protein